MTGRRVLVVGAGLAAAQLVSGLRDLGWDGELTVVGDEERAPYHRPPLSKAYLKGALPSEQLDLRAPGFYRDRGVGLVLGDQVVDLGLGPSGGGTARCSSGRLLAYDRVVLATGAAPRRLPFLSGLQGVHDLRSVADAERLREELRPGARVVVLGAGFVGLEVAATARALACAVTVVETGDRVLGRVAGPEVAAHVTAHHRDLGIDILLGMQARHACSEAGRITGVALSDSTLIEADVVVVGIGAEPRVALAADAGLRCAGGIVVDAAARASDGITLAIGDCAVGPDRSPGGDPAESLRLESVDHATQGAAAAAATIAGTEAPVPTPPWFWSDQGDLKLQVVGVAQPDDERVVRRDGARLVCAHYRGGRLVAGEAVDSPADFMALRKAVTAGVDLPPDAVADPSVRLARLMSAQRV